MEVVAHGNLRIVRALTTPVKPPSPAVPLRSAQLPAAIQQMPRDMNSANIGADKSLIHSKGHTSSNYSIQSQPSSRSSDGTQGTSASILFPPPPLPPLASSASYISSGDGSSIHISSEAAPPTNIMNSVADASTSLFQICVALRQRLADVPGFDKVFHEEDINADADTDPVTFMWRSIRRGYPLLYLSNALQPSSEIAFPDKVKPEKRDKACTFKFLQTCLTELRIPQEELFILADLYGDDTTGFTKVARVIHRVLDILVQRGAIHDSRTSASAIEQAENGIKRTQRQHIIAELVNTERTYVNHLELLQAFKHLVEEKGVVSGYTVHHIFLNLNALLDFQRRFLIRVEQTNALSEDEQNWGNVFLTYGEAFKVYEPYIANQRRCERTVVAEFSKLKEAGGSLEMRQMIESPTSLYGFLMKPFQRLSKYPLLLDDLFKKGDLDEARKQNLLQGKEIATAVLARTNEAVDREEKAEIVEELKVRVEDWKGHRVEAFGELLLFGPFSVVKSENLAAGKDGERQYHVYLFENILLCCKSIDLSKPKNRLAKGSLVDTKGKPKLQLKGRIFMQNVTDLVSLAKPGSYTCQIFWKGDPGIENFIIRFSSEELLKKWAQRIETQRRKNRERSFSTRTSDSIRVAGTSATEFPYMQNLGQLENPYRNEMDEDDEDDNYTIASAGTTNSAWPPFAQPPKGDLVQNRSGSANSLRSRSATGESSFQAPYSATPSRNQHPKLPAGSIQQPTLSLRTRELQQGSQSPNSESHQDSYFSPLETPMSSAMSLSSSRISGASMNASMYPFPRQTPPQSSEYYQDSNGNARFTAPAMPRSQQHTSGPSNGYAPPGRGQMPRPSFPSGSGMHSAQQLPTQSRNRSASSPDIHNGPRAGPNAAANQPPVPHVPASFSQQYAQQAAIHRGQNGSPVKALVLPGRGSPQLQMQRERQSSRQEYSPVDYQGHGGPLRHLEAQHYPTSRTVTPVPSRTPYPPPQASAAMSPEMHASLPPFNDPLNQGPSQLKVKVICPSASQTLTLVVPTTITYQSLKDRIDAKLQRSTNLSLSDRGPRESQVKLKYLDDDDYVSIQSDEDVQTAFEAWREQHGNDFIGGMGEIELYCQR